MVVSERKSGAERREEILDAALPVFGELGLHGASTDEIARRAGISQPYVFRLFGTKKGLYLALVARCFRQTLELMQRAAEGMRGEEALNAIGTAYGELIAADSVYLRNQMQAYAVRHGYGDLVTYVERVSDADAESISRFFAQGMLLNVLASMNGPAEAWGARLVEGCKADQ
jgi:AcrR family transcriptional regulator